ncbi:hypothetical protein NPIL_195501 [Nephila pilipes]|uniref:Uncharacterized protein n=1 Tax=Nephila pilipes TaxID=299642 RepID=A0A8X6TGW9_NEPPI|nr:hypothetical protein NPIL_195501 [Nephila pilipes]
MLSKTSSAPQGRWHSARRERNGLHGSMNPLRAVRRKEHILGPAFQMSSLECFYSDLKWIFFLFNINQAFVRRLLRFLVGKVAHLLMSSFVRF